MQGDKKDKKPKNRATVVFNEFVAIGTSPPVRNSM
jgi:hypothetical protein